MTECAICLTTIGRDNEAYLYPCFHRFCFSCIRQWTSQQLRHDAAQPCPAHERCSYACPLCKQPYTYVAYDCVGNTCRLLATCGQPPTMSAMPLTVDQSRRRALYVTRQQQQQQQVAPGSQALAPLRPRGPSHPQTAEWVERELQAVLLAADVGVILQHVLGVLGSLAAKQQAKPAGPPSSSLSSLSTDQSPVYGSRQVFLSSVARSVQDFLPEHASAFADELWAFLHCGLSVAAYDNLVFGEDGDKKAEAASPRDDDSDHEALPTTAAAAQQTAATAAVSGAHVVSQQMLLDGLEDE